MVDRYARDIFAAQLRALLTGRITNDAFESALVASRDRAMAEIYRHGAMWLYSHFEEHTLSGAFAPPREERPALARWILFLKTEQEYEWRHRSFWAQQWDHLVRALSFGWLGKEDYADVAFAKPYSGDLNVWPFLRREDFEKALGDPPYLCGKSTANSVSRA